MAWRSAWPGAAARAAATAAWAVVLTAGGIGPASAAGTITCTYTVVNAWNGGFNADVDIANNGPTISGWTVRWTFADPTGIDSSWQATISNGDGRNTTATNVSYNGVVRTGQVTSFGWSAHAASTAIPTNLTINGARC